MRTPALIAVAALAVSLLAGCNAGPAKPVATPTPPPPVSHTKEVRTEMRSRLADTKVIWHAGCRDPEKSSCADPTRICGTGAAKRIAAAAKKENVVIEWEAPRLTWAKNEGVLNHYWFVKPDGSGDYFFLIPSPDDIQTDCGNGKYCGWHKETFAAGTLLASGKLHLKPHDGKEEIADLDFCPEPPPQ